MKKTILILAALGGGIYFAFKGLYALIWRTVIVATIGSPLVMAFYLAYALNVLHWKIETLWVMPPLVLIALVTASREFQWTEPLIRQRK